MAANACHHQPPCPRCPCPPCPCQGTKCHRALVLSAGMSRAPVWAQSSTAPPGSLGRFPLSSPPHRLRAVTAEVSLGKGTGTCSAAAPCGHCQGTEQSGASCGCWWQGPAGPRCFTSSRSPILRPEQPQEGPGLLARARGWAQGWGVLQVLLQLPRQHQAGSPPVPGA